MRHPPTPIRHGRSGIDGMQHPLADAPNYNPFTWQVTR
jgi:hypothetical protein